MPVDGLVGASDREQPQPASEEPGPSDESGLVKKWSCSACGVPIASRARWANHAAVVNCKGDWKMTTYGKPVSGFLFGEKLREEVLVAHAPSPEPEEDHAGASVIGDQIPSIFREPFNAPVYSDHQEGNSCLPLTHSCFMLMFFYLGVFDVPTFFIRIMLGVWIII